MAPSNVCWRALCATCRATCCILSRCKLLVPLLKLGLDGLRGLEEHGGHHCGGAAAGAFCCFGCLLAYTSLCAASFRSAPSSSMELLTSATQARLDARKRLKNRARPQTDRSGVGFCDRQIRLFASSRRPEGSHACRSESTAGLDAAIPIELQAFAADRCGPKRDAQLISGRWKTVLQPVTAIPSIRRETG